MERLSHASRLCPERHLPHVCWMLVRAAPGWRGVPRRPGVLDALPQAPRCTPDSSQTTTEAVDREVGMNQNQRPPHAMNVVTPGAWSWVGTPPRYARSTTRDAVFARRVGGRWVARTAAWSSCCCFHKTCRF